MIYFSQLIQLLAANEDLNQHGVDVRALQSWWHRPLRASGASLNSLATTSFADLILGEGVDSCMELWQKTRWQECDAARYLRFAAAVAGSDSLTTCAFVPIWLEWMIGVNQAREAWLDWENSPGHVLIDDAERSKAWSQGLSYIKAGLSGLAASFWVDRRKGLEDSLAAQSERFLQGIEQMHAANELAMRVGIEPPTLADAMFINAAQIGKTLDSWFRTDLEVAVRRVFWRAQTEFLECTKADARIKLSRRYLTLMFQLMQSARQNDPVRKQEVKELLSVNRKVVELLLDKFQPRFISLPNRPEKGNNIVG